MGYIRRNDDYLDHATHRKGENYMLVRYNNIMHSSAFDLFNAFRLFGDLDKNVIDHRSDSLDEDGIKIELPGIKISDVNVSIDDRVLSVSGKSRRGIEFNYSYTLKSLVDVQAVTAKLTDGLLTISLPKKETLGARKVVITA